MYDDDRVKVAFIGSDGLPARYGGWETFVEQLGPKLVDKYKVLVIGSASDRASVTAVYRGVNCVNLPLKAHGVSSLFFDFFSIIYCIITRQKHIVMLGSATALFLPFFKPFLGRVYVNVDGVEWRRDKWGWVARALLKLSEKIAVKWSDVVIADNLGIEDFIKNNYAPNKLVMIPYGGDHSLENDQAGELPISKEEIQQSFLSICRIEPENNVELILKSFVQTKKNIIFVGNWQNSEYGRSLVRRFDKYKNLKLIESVYDKGSLYTLRSLCLGYVHGHSAGGTNPSLVEIMFHKKLILAFDCSFNRYTLNNSGVFFHDQRSLVCQLSNYEAQIQLADAAFKFARQNYTWKKISSQYDNMISRD